MNVFRLHQKPACNARVTFQLSALGQMAKVRSPYRKKDQFNMSNVVRVKPVLAGLVATSFAALAQAQTATIPTTAEMSTSIGAIGGIAGVAAAVGFSIWIYRKVKAKAGQAVS